MDGHELEMILINKEEKPEKIIEKEEKKKHLSFSLSQ
jgi:hypothetical protein